MSDVFANFVANLSAFLTLTDLESGDDATKSGVVKDRKLPEVIAMLSTALFDQFFQQRNLCNPAARHPRCPRWNAVSSCSKSDLFRECVGPQE